MNKDKTILVVDDSEAIRQAVYYMLLKKGYKVLLAKDGQDSLQHLTGQEIDLIISDLHMPIMDGIGLIRQVRKNEHYKRVPILVLTTESQLSIKNKAKNAGATGWILKPFETEKLLLTIHKVLR